MTSEQVYRRPVKFISLKEKLSILKQLDTGSTRREIEEIFKCSQSTICRILASKDNILQEAKVITGDKQENLTANNYAYKELYKALTKWAKEVKKTNGVITAHGARKKAEELSKNMGQKLSPSNAWLYRWKERENVVFTKKPKKPKQIVKDTVQIQEELQIHSDNIHKEPSKRLNLNEEKARFPISGNYQEDISKNQQTAINISKIFNKHRSKRKYTKKLPTGIISKRRKEKTFLTLLQKLELLQRLRNGERRLDLIEEYNLSQSAITQIVNEEEKILRVAAKGQNLQMKRIRGGIFRDGESELNNWVLEKMAKGESLTKTQIKTRAKEIAENLSIDFKASTGWLEKWKARMNMEFNENQVLHRKVPQYLANEADSNSGIEPEDHLDYFESQEIKHVVTDYNYNYNMDNRYELNCEIKSEYITPQQFYLQTIDNDRLAEQRNRKHRENKIQLTDDENESEETEKKLFIVSSLRLESAVQGKEAFQDNAFNLKETFIKEETEMHEKEMILKPQVEETLQDRIQNWLSRYHIESSAAKELLDILNNHLDMEINSTN